MIIVTQETSTAAYPSNFYDDSNKLTKACHASKTNTIQQFSNLWELLTMWLKSLLALPHSNAVLISV